MVCDMSDDERPGYQISIAASQSGIPLSTGGASHQSALPQTMRQSVCSDIIRPCPEDELVPVWVNRPPGAFMFTRGSSSAASALWWLAPPVLSGIPRLRRGNRDLISWPLVIAHVAHHWAGAKGRGRADRISRTAAKAVALIKCVGPHRILDCAYASDEHIENGASCAEATKIYGAVRAPISHSSGTSDEN